VLEDMDNDEECVETSILTPEDTSGMVGTSTTQCQISWPTSMAAPSGIRDRLVLEW